MFLSQFDFIIDGIFGFSFKPPIRNPYDCVISALKNTKIPVLSIDIPSGWDIEKGNVDNSFEPEYLISLTLPKEGSKNFKGKHFLGGRFLPK